MRRSGLINKFLYSISSYIAYSWRYPLQRHRARLTLSDLDIYGQIQTIKTA